MASLSCFSSRQLRSSSVGSLAGLHWALSVNMEFVCNISKYKVISLYMHWKWHGAAVVEGGREKHYRRNPTPPLLCVLLWHVAHSRNNNIRSQAEKPVWCWYGYTQVVCLACFWRELWVCRWNKRREALNLWMTHGCSLTGLCTVTICCCCSLDRSDRTLQFFNCGRCPQLSTV